MSESGRRSTEVDAYIASQPPETRRALEELRSCIWEAAPEAAELMNYNIPAFALVDGGKRDQQIMIAGYAQHVGLYPNPDVIDAFRDRLEDYKFANRGLQVRQGLDPVSAEQADPQGVGRRNGEAQAFPVEEVSDPITTG